MKAQPRPGDVQIRVNSGAPITTACMYPHIIICKLYCDSNCNCCSGSVTGVRVPYKLAPFVWIKTLQINSLAGYVICQSHCIGGYGLHCLY